MKAGKLFKEISSREMTKKQFIICAIACIVVGTIVANAITYVIKAVL